MILFQQSSHAMTYLFAIVLQQILHDFDGVKCDVAQLKEQGRKLVDTSDGEGYQAQQSTLSILSARVENLQTLADIKSNQLQVRMICK
jgi:hypothetical protein